MADLEFVEGDFGDSYVVAIKESDGTLANLSAYDTAILLINSKDLATNKTNATCTIQAGASTVTWAMTSGETNYDGSFVAQIQLSHSGGSIAKNTKLLSVKANRKLAS